MAAQALVVGHQVVPGRKVRQRPQPSLTTQQSGILTQLLEAWHQLKPASQTHWPQLLLLFGQSAGMGKQELVSAHQLKPGFRVRQFPQASLVAQQSGISTQALRATHHEKLVVVQTHCPHPLWLLGQSAGICAQVFVAAHQVVPGRNPVQRPQLSFPAQQVGMATQLCRAAHQLWPVGQIQRPQASKLIGQEAGI